MPFVPTPLVNGDVMLWSDVAENFSDLRTWLNDIDDDDITTAAIQREHLERPVINGFPLNGSSSSFQAVYWAKYGFDQPDVFTSYPWGATPDRLIIIPEAANGSDDKWKTPIGRTVHIPTISNCEVIVTFDLQVRAALGIVYRTVLVMESEPGYFAIHIYSRTDDSDQEIEHSIQHIYPQNFGDTAYRDKVEMLAVFDLPTGWHDVMLVYHRNASLDTIYQVDLTRISFNLEVL